MQSWFLPNTLGDKPALDFVCQDAHPHHGSAEVRARIVKASSRGVVSRAMREWSELGWYRMVAYAAMREQCCNDPAPIHTPHSFEDCSFDPQLSAVAIAAATNSALDAPMEEYERSVACMLNRGAGNAFELQHLPDASERRTFRDVVARVHAKR
jgi:hypothetical protein